MARIDKLHHEYHLRNDREVLAQIKRDRIPVVRWASKEYSSRRLRALVRKGRGFPEAYEPLSHQEVVAAYQIQLSFNARSDALGRRSSYRNWREFHDRFGPNRPASVRLAEKRDLIFIRTMQQMFGGYRRIGSPLEGVDFSKGINMKIGVEFGPIPFDAARLEPAPAVGDVRRFFDHIVQLPADWITSVYDRNIAGLSLRCVDLGSQERPAVTLAAEPYRQDNQLEIFRATILARSNRVDTPFYQGVGLLAIDSAYEAPMVVFVPSAERGEVNAERLLMRRIRQARTIRLDEIEEENRRRSIDASFFAEFGSAD